MEKKREMLHYLCRRQNEPRQPPSSFLSSSSSSPPSLAAMHSTSNPGCNRRCSRGKSSEKTIRATVLLSLPPLPLALAFPRGEEEFFQRAASNLSRDCFVPFLPPIRAMPRNAFYSLRGSARVSRRRLHGCIYITCSSVDISLFFSCFVFFLEWFPLVFGRVDSIGMHDVWSSYSLCRAPFPWMSLGVCADPRLDLAIWFKIFLSLFSSSFRNENSFEVSIWWRQVELIFREGAPRRPTFRINGEEI